MQDCSEMHLWSQSDFQIFPQTSFRYNLQSYLKTFLLVTNLLLIQKSIRIIRLFNIQAFKIAIVDFRNFSFLMQIDLVDLDILLTL